MSGDPWMEGFTIEANTARNTAYLSGHYEHWALQAPVSISVACYSVNPECMGNLDISYVRRRIQDERQRRQHG